MRIQGFRLGNTKVIAGIPAVSAGLQLYYDPATYSGSGTSLNDLSGNGFTGILQNIDTSNYTQHYFNYNGASSNLQTPDMVSAFSNTPAVTYELWVWAANVGCCVAENGSSSLSAVWYDNQMEIGGDAGPPWQLYSSLWSGGAFTPPSPMIQQNTWYQVVLTYNGTVGTGYVNGVKGGSNNSFTRAAPWDSGAGYYLNFGASTGTVLYSHNWWSGAIGIVRAYNRGLTDIEVLQNFNATRGIYGI